MSAKKYFSSQVNESSEYTSKLKNIEMMKSSKSSKNPNRNYRLNGNEFIQFLNYDNYLSLVKAYTDMNVVLCNDCKCKSRPPSSIIDGISSYQCFGELKDIMASCDNCRNLLPLFPYGKFVNQNFSEPGCFQFPRKITNDPCTNPCDSNSYPIGVGCGYTGCTENECDERFENRAYRSKRRKRSKSRGSCNSCIGKGCKPNLKGNMRPCCYKQTVPCEPYMYGLSDSDSESDCDVENCKKCFKQSYSRTCNWTETPQTITGNIPVTFCGNPLLKCSDPCNPCKKYIYQTEVEYPCNPPNPCNCK